MSYNRWPTAQYHEVIHAMHELGDAYHRVACPGHSLMSYQRLRQKVNWP